MSLNKTELIYFITLICSIVVMIQEIIAKRPELVYLRDEDGDTPLHYTVDIGYLGGFYILLQNSLLKWAALERNKNGNLPLHLACKRGNLEMVKEFFKPEWPIDPYVLLNQKGQNIIHIAAKNGRSNVIEFLLSHCKTDHLSINQNDNDGNTPLHLASKNLFPRVIYFITKDNRTDVNLTNKDGLTARDITRTFDFPMFNERKMISDMVLEAAGVPVHEKNFFSEAFLIVVALFVTVSFAAAFTVPGGIYSSDEPKPEIRGTAVLAPKSLFGVFTTFNIITMFASAMACGILSMGMYLPHNRTKATHISFACLSIAYLAAPVAFVAAILLVVSNDHPLAVATGCIGVFLNFVTVVYIYLPQSHWLQRIFLSLRRLKPFSLIGDTCDYLNLRFLVFYPFRKIDGKPKIFLRSQKANKN